MRKLQAGLNQQHLPAELRKDKASSADLAPAGGEALGSDFFMNSKGEPMHISEMPPSNSMIMTTTGQPVDVSKADITGKSVQQLRKMGFETVLDF